MTSRVQDISGHRCLFAGADGPVVRDADGGRALIEDAMNAGARVIVVPVARLDAEFFRLRSGLAGDVLQKAMNYGFKFVVLGNIADYVAGSEPLRDFVVESNRGTSIFFAADADALAGWLSAIRARA
jgi:hypothetical protein